MIPRSYRQTKLAVSADNLLILDQNPPHPEASQESYILKLPNELLDRILTLASEPKHRWYRRCLPMQDGARTLILVCQRFYEISLPLLYRSIFSAYRTEFVPPSKAVRALHGNLRDRPSLRPLCLTLHVHVPDSGFREDRNPQDWKIAKEIITWLTNVRQFTIHGGFQKWPVIQWDFIRKVCQCMLNMQSLDLSREHWNLCLAPLFESIRFHQFGSLTIRGASPDGNNTTEPRLPESEFRKGTFKTLNLSDFTESLSALRNLIHWPKELHHFSYSDTDSGRNGWNTVAFGPLLALHKETLQSIRLVSLFSRNPRSCIDVSDYPNLHSITMPTWDMECTPEEAASKFFAPRLRTFTWSFTRIGQTDETIDCFTESRANWLRRFITLAIDRKSALRKVHIDLSIRDWYPSHMYMTEDSYVYPVDRMDWIAAEFEPYGVSVTHEEPDITKEEINQMIEQAKIKARSN